MTRKVRLAAVIVLTWAMLLMIMFAPSTEKAMHTGSASCFTLEEPHDDPEGFLRRSMFVRYDKDYTGLLVVCYDAAADGRIALGFRTRDGLCYAAVLDAQGKHLYGFSFGCTGDFLLDWTEGGLGIYWVRSAVLAVFDGEGRCLSMDRVDVDSASSRHISALHSTVRILPDGSRLRLCNADDAPAAAYARLVRIAPDGMETVLYEATGSTAGAVWIWRVLLTVVGVLLNWMEIRKFKTHKDPYRQPQLV